MKHANRSAPGLWTFAPVLAAAIALFWWRLWIPLDAGRMYFSGDILIKDYPLRMGLFRILREGAVPFWDPWQFGGWPGLANCEAGVFYPPNWLLIFFVNKPEAAFMVSQWLVLGHFFIAGLGACALSRHYGLSGHAAAFAGTAFALCGFHSAHKQHTNMIFALAWLPWVLFQAEHWLARREPGRLVSMALLSALSIFAGHPQASLYMMLFVFARFVFASVPGRGATPARVALSFVKTTAPFMAALALAASITAVQWIPTLELIRLGERSDAARYERSAEFSLPPHELVDAFLPEIFTDWGQTEVFYWGVAPPALALFAVASGAARGPLAFLALAGAASALLAMGRFTFWFDLSYVLVPGAAWVRAPSRWIYFASLPIAVLGGAAIDRFRAAGAGMASNQPCRRFAWLVLAASLSVFLGAAVWLTAAAGGIQGLDTDRFRPLVNALLLLGFNLAAVALLLSLSVARRIAPAAFASLLIALTWGDLATRFRTFGMEKGRGGYQRTAESEYAKSLEEGRRFKVFIAAGGDRTRFHGAAQGFREFDGNSPLTPRIHLELRKDTALDDPKRPNLALLRMFNTAAALTDNPLTAGGMETKTGWMQVFKDPPVRARVLPDAFEVERPLQRELLTLQSFPRGAVAMVGPGANVPREESGQTPLGFPKPFLLSGASAQSVAPSARLIVDGTDLFHSTPDRPGYYLASADPVTGRVESLATYNLMAGFSEPGMPAHRAMRDFIDRVPAGHTVFAALSDSGAEALGAAGLNALRDIGAVLDLRRTGYQHAHVIAGTKGAPPGTALEAASATEALILQTGRGLYVRGGAVPPNPGLRLIADTSMAAAWFRLYSETVPMRPRPHGPVTPDNADYNRFPVPMMIHSSPAPPGRASILINGRELAAGGGGYNLAILDPVTLAPVRTGTFNLIADYDIDNPTNGYVRMPAVENLRMTGFLRSAEAGQIVVGAVNGEATDLLQPYTLEALRGLGLAFPIELSDPAARKRNAHAFFAIAETGPAYEAHGKQTDAVLFTRIPGGPRPVDSDFPPGVPPAAPIDTMEELRKETAESAPFRDPEAGPPWRVAEHAPHHLVIEGDSESGGLLFVGEIAFPGWTARLDGVPVPIETVNYYFRAVRVPPGRHTVEMEYRPENWRAALALSLAGWLALILSILVSKRVLSN